jgi:hypothetical protein
LPLSPNIEGSEALQPPSAPPRTIAAKLSAINPQGRDP